MIESQTMDGSPFLLLWRSKIDGSPFSVKAVSKTQMDLHFQYYGDPKFYGSPFVSHKDIKISAGSPFLL